MQHFQSVGFSQDLLHCCSLFFFQFQGLRLQISFDTFFISQRLRVHPTFLSRISHHFFVLCLCILLINCGRLHLLCQVSLEHVEHCHDTSMLFALFFVSSPSFWRRWRRYRCGTVLLDLGQHWWLCGCCLTTHVYCNSLLCGQFLFGWSNVQLWRVELCQAISGHCKQLLCCSVGSHELFVRGILCLAVLSRFNNRFVEVFDALH
mmetsp:Transcript_33126/g.65279  ORF Transcript_33126/g.65279 Transcript_33126/m.65279 type:complete len:205 (-) Transcript_33126:1412-2026(-)